MAKRRTKRRGRSWFSIITFLLAGGTAVFYQAYQWTALAPNDKTRIFSAYADLNLSAQTVQRMRASPFPPKSKPESARWHRIARVIDGDSIELESGEKIRLIGIDTPESSENNELFRDLGRMGGTADKRQLIALGKEASRYARSRAEGRSCWLEYEKDQTDMYGRSLAYIHLDDGTILNEEMLYRGYARVYLSSAFKYKKRYVLLQMAAMTRRHGFWAGEDSDRASPPAHVKTSALTSDGEN